MQNLPQTLNDIKKRLERESSEANERLMARLKQKRIVLQAAQEEELLAQVGGKLMGWGGGGGNYLRGCRLLGDDIWRPL
jgi:hypothetical protein